MCLFSGNKMEKDVHRKKQQRSNSAAVVCHKLHEAKISHIVSLNNMKLRQLPDDLFCLQTLKHLYISHCLLTGDLPIEIGLLKHLRSLDASCNKITSIPDNLFTNLRQLEILDLRKNRLTSIPYSIGEMLDLQELCLSNNQLVALPHTLANLRCLKTLNVSYNLIRRIQGEIFLGKLSASLQVLILNNNLLDLVPREIGNLQNLTELDVCNNQLYFLPSSAVHLKKILVFRHAGNKWSTTAREFQDLDVNTANSYGGSAYKKLKLLVNFDA